MTPVHSPIVVPKADTAYRELAGLIDRFSPIDGEHRTAIPALSFYRYSRPTTPECGVSRAALIFAAQGAKRITAGGVTCEYDRTRCVIMSVDLPAVSQVTIATPAKPYLCLVLALDLPRVAEVIARMPVQIGAAASGGSAMTMCAVRPELLDAAFRLAKLLETPRDIAVLAPLLEQEIVYRLLLGGHGPRLRQLALAGSQFNKITRAVDWLRTHYTEPLRMDELAQRTNMSVSSLHHHFKEVTSLSPLQYQKQLRLHEARRLLVGQACDVGSAARQVGYESASHFSREYNRLFGASPSADLQLRKVIYGIDRHAP
jgi:AraC-like DNA-binding protein